MYIIKKIVVIASLIIISLPVDAAKDSTLCQNLINAKRVVMRKFIINSDISELSDEEYYSDLMYITSSKMFDFSNKYEFLYKSYVYYGMFDSDERYDFIMGCTKVECVGTSLPVYHIFLSKFANKRHNTIVGESMYEPFIIMNEGGVAIGFEKKSSNRKEDGEWVEQYKFILMNGDENKEITCYN